MPALRPVSFGVLAHVDAGKTTLSEQLLYRAGVLRAPGRVDHGDTALDVAPVERARGVTVFSNQAWFPLDGRRFTLMDTPGHVGFCAEAERALLALDMAVLLIDGSAGVRGHTLALYRLAKAYRVPMLVFINKMDLVQDRRERVLAQLRGELCPDLVLVEAGAPDPEQLALLDDAFCQRYLNGDVSEDDAWNALAHLFQQGKALPVLTGVALAGQGVDGLLAALARLAHLWDIPDGEEAREENAPAEAVAYQVRHEDSGERVTYLKVLSGVLRPKDGFLCDGETEKIHQLRLYRGASYQLAECAVPGDTVGVTGLSSPRCGDRLTKGALQRGCARFSFTPMLAVRVSPCADIPPNLLLSRLRTLEDEEPMLQVEWDGAHSAAILRVMGPLQAEIIAQLLLERYQMAVDMLPPLVLYRETVAAPVVGCGHYEPLRHYAEVHLRLSPASKGSGVSFASRCPVDDLPASYQSQVRAHVLEKAHPGVLTGSPLTDVTVELLSGKAHLKHTEGGDFREATYRALRQGLQKAESVLLEPFYRFTLTLPAECLGRAMTDILALSGSYDAPESLGDRARLTGRGPVSCLMEYPVQVRAYTRGKGELLLEPDGYDPCHNRDEVIAQLGYRAQADVENPAGSVFCAHGAGFYVAWDKADEWMHLPVEK